MSEVWQACHIVNVCNTTGVSVNHFPGPTAALTSEDKTLVPLLSCILCFLIELCIDMQTADLCNLSPKLLHPIEKSLKLTSPAEYKALYSKRQRLLRHFKECYGVK